jgi:hypothetical protein
MSDRTEESDSPPTGRVADADQRMAGGRWLLSATVEHGQARAAWAESGAAWVTPGGLCTPVTVQAGMVHLAVGKYDPRQCAPLLTSALDGPVFYQPRAFGDRAGYVVLLPVSARHTWRVRGTVVLPSRGQLLVPAPDRVEPSGENPWWVVPVDEQGTLCSPELLASLLAPRTPLVRREAADA